MPRRIGVLVNPDAGLGGRLGFKGSDGRAEEARAAGAEERSGPRMVLCMEHLAGLDVEFITCSAQIDESSPLDDGLLLDDSCEHQVNLPVNKDTFEARITL
mgnify:CR=1 FL=1